MVVVRQTGEFRDCLMGLRDGIAKAKVASRIRRLEDGNFGDVKPLGGGLSEMRVHHGRDTGSIS